MYKLKFVVKGYTQLEGIVINWIFVHLLSNLPP